MTNALIIRPLAITHEMITSTNAGETYPLVGTRGLGIPEDQQTYELYEFGSIWRSAETYRLFESLVGPYPRKICTITNANPAVVTAYGHGLAEGQIITFTGPAEGDTLAEDIDIGRPYFVRNPTTDTFNLSSDNVDLAAASLVATDFGAPGDGNSYFQVGDSNSEWWNQVDPGDPEFDAELAEILTDELGSTVPVTPRWLDIGPDNVHAMFDAINGSATVWAGDGQMTIEPGTRIDAAGFENLLGTSLRIRVDDGGGDVYDTTFPLINNDEVTDFYSFFFGERTQRQTLIVDDLPTWVLAPAITIDLTADADNVAQIGTASFGRQFDIGLIEAGLGLAIDDFTLKDRDAFGRYNLVERDFSKVAEARALLPSTRRASVIRVLAAHRATPLFWKLGEDEDQQIFGLWSGFSAEATPPNDIITYEIEGAV